MNIMYELQLLLPIYLYVTTAQGYHYIEKGHSCQAAVGVFGTCVHFSDCEWAIQEVRRRGYPEICGFDGLFPIVCCPYTGVPHFPTFQSPSSTSKPDLVQDRMQSNAQAGNTERNNTKDRLPFDGADVNQFSTSQIPNRMSTTSTTRISTTSTTRISTTSTTNKPELVQSQMPNRISTISTTNKPALVQNQTPNSINTISTTNKPGLVQEGSQKNVQVENREGNDTTSRLLFDESNLSLWKCRDYRASRNNSQTRRFPHTALLGYVETIDGNKIIQWKCIGSLISEKFVLTSARCAKPQRIGTLKYVQLGRLDLNSSTQDSELQDFTVKQTYVHPEFHYLSIYNDIGLIELNKPVRFTESVNPACLAATQNLNGALLETAGYGLLQSANKLSSNQIKYGSSVNCKEIYDTNLKGGNVTNEFICAEGAVDTGGNCNMDIGGPLQRTNMDFEFGSFTEVVGIYLFGSLCNKSGDIFVSVSPFVSWIENIVWPNL